MGACSKQKGTHFYLQWNPADWITDPGLRRCSAPAKGVWIDMVMAMFFEKRRGVLPGDRALLGRILPHDGETIDAALAELAEHGVFSYGREVDRELEPTDLVNRRMYRAYRLSRVRAAAGRKGGQARKSPAAKASATPKTPATAKSGKKRAARKQTAPATTADAQDVSAPVDGGMRQDQGAPPGPPSPPARKQNAAPITRTRTRTTTTVRNRSAEDPRSRVDQATPPSGAYGAASVFGSADQSLTREAPAAYAPEFGSASADVHQTFEAPAAYAPDFGSASAAHAIDQETRPQQGAPAQPDPPAAQSGCVHSAGGLTAIGAFFGGLPSLEDYLKRVYRVSRDDAAWRAWWKEALSALQQHPDGMCHFEDDLCYVEQCLDPVKRARKDLGPLKAPGKFLVKRLLQWARNHQVSMPRLPEAPAVVYAANAA